MLLELYIQFMRSPLFQTFNAPNGTTNGRSGRSESSSSSIIEKSIQQSIPFKKGKWFYSAGAYRKKHSKRR